MACSAARFPFPARVGVTKEQYEDQQRQAQQERLQRAEQEAQLQRQRREELERQLQQQTAQPQPAAWLPQPARPSDTLGILALVAGVMALVLSPFPVLNGFGFLLGILAVVLGIIGATKYASGMATAGVWCGAGAICVSFLLGALVYGAVGW